MRVRGSFVTLLGTSQNSWGKLMGNLPPDRLRESRPFKSICFRLLWVVLRELQDQVETPVKPFIWRRGLSDMMLSDNPTNFVGPRNVLKELQTVFLKNKERLTGYAGRPEVYPPRGNSGEIRQASAGAKLHRSQLWRGDHTRAPHHRAALSCAAASGSGESSNKPRPAYLKR